MWIGRIKVRGRAKRCGEGPSARYQGAAPPFSGDRLPGLQFRSARDPIRLSNFTILCESVVRSSVSTADNLQSKGDPMGSRTGLAIVLAAGEGTRMASRRPKVLHAIGGRSLLGHVLAAIGPTPAFSVVVVTGPDQDAVGAEARRFRPDAQIVFQNERRGTAHAALAAREALTGGFDDILILFGDTPLITPATLARLRDALAHGAAVAVLGFRATDPTGYGRLIVKADRLVAIREQQDATAEERGTTLCNAGLMAL